MRKGDHESQKKKIVAADTMQKCRTSYCNKFKRSVRKDKNGKKVIQAVAKRMRSDKPELCL